MSMLTKVIEARKAQDAEKARRDKIVWDGVVVRWALYLATWRRVEAALQELEGTRVKIETRRGGNLPNVTENLPLRLTSVKPPTGDTPRSVGYGDGVLKLYVLSDKVRHPLGYVWTPPPPPKRKPKGWTPPTPPLGAPLAIDFLSVSCAFEMGYWNGDNHGGYSRKLDDYKAGQKVWKTVQDYSPYCKEEGTEEQVLAYVASRVATSLADDIPELEQAARERAVDMSGRPLDV